jgi:hypothetical protein
MHGGRRHAIGIGDDIAELAGIGIAFEEDAGSSIRRVEGAAGLGAVGAEPEEAAELE